MTLGNILHTLIVFLDFFGEISWKKVFLDIENGNCPEERAVKKVLLHSGMGGFNDLVICRLNGHMVSKEFESVANFLLGYLRSLVFVVADQEGGEVSADGIVKIFSSLKKVIPGLKCTKCKYRVVFEKDIENYLIRESLRRGVLLSLEKKELVEYVEEIVRCDKKMLLNCRDKKDLVDRAVNSKILVVSEEDAMVGCPKCGKGTIDFFPWEIG